MKKKIIAIGNRIMADDAIGINVVEEIKEELEGLNIEVIIGETDCEFCLDCIEDHDLIFVVDAMATGKTPGVISVIPFYNLEQYNQSSYSQHDDNLINKINTFNKSIIGFVIGIEISGIYFDTELSKELKNKFSSICEEVKKIILKNEGGGNYA